LKNSKTQIKNEKSNERIDPVTYTGGLDSRCDGNDIGDWGIDDIHPWAGITKFKLGFVKLGITGEVLDFPGAYDLPLKKVWYNGLSWLNKLRKAI